MKRIISLLLVFCMLFSVVSTTVFAAEDNQGTSVNLANPFKDVKETDWFYDAVQYSRINGFFNGISNTEFDPNGTMTRGMFVTVLGRMAGVDAENYAGQSVFKDVSVSKWYAPYVAWAAKHGITTGTEDGNFSPDALINRQQMATFLVRYFEAFDVDYSTDANVTTIPADMDIVASWAQDAVLKLWAEGLLNGDGTNFNPDSSATRSQAAAVAMRADEAVDIWYKEPGVPSDRVRINPVTGLPYETENEDIPGDEDDKTQVEEDASDSKTDQNKDKTYQTFLTYLVRHVSFYDGNRLIDMLTTITGTPLGALPTVEKSSKPGYVLEGYYLDREFTKPFYPDNIVYLNTKVYAKYTALERDEQLTVTTFTQMDLKTSPVFEIQSLDGTVVNDNTVLLETKDGSEPVKLVYESYNDGITRISAENGFTSGCSYELHLLDNNLIFYGKADTIRTATFSMYREEEQNLKLNDDIQYVAYDNMGSLEDTFEGTRTLDYEGELQEGVVCLYTGTHPAERTAVGTSDDSNLLDPVVYVKITGGSSGHYTYEQLSQEDQISLYELPDNFPLNLPEPPQVGNGTVNLADLDISMYENMMGSTLGTMEAALTKIDDKHDFVTLYSGAIEEGVTEIVYGKITDYDEETGEITYTVCTADDILNSMNLYANVDLDGDDLLSDKQASALEATLQAQVEESGFAREAADLLAELVVKSDGFRNNPTVQDLLLTDENGNPVSEEQIELLGVLGYEIRNVNISVRLIKSGSSLHFKGGVQMRLSLRAELVVSDMTIKMSASFVEEVTIKPTIQASLTKTTILGVPVPNGVKVDTQIAVKNYTAFDFDAELYSGNVSCGSVSDRLDEVMEVADRTGVSPEYEEALQELMDEYAELVTKETDWVQLVEEQICRPEFNVYALKVGVETTFVVHADMSLAIGSAMEYEVGKQYNFWFRIGLYTPTSGSDTMDLLDERFAFQFYVMGKLGVRAGVKARLYVGVGVASVGISAEMGPYVKMWGFFVYEYNKLRPSQSTVPQTTSRMYGGLTMEMGMYFVVAADAEALGLFEYSYNFLEEEVPILTAGEKRYYYDLVEPLGDEMVVLRDEDYEKDGITMYLPAIVRTMKFINLETGVLGTEPNPDHSDFNVYLSDPHFSYNKKTGMLSVAPPDDDVYIMECEMTVTYNKGKQALTDYDMTITIPLVYTLLSENELNEYKYVSVCVTDGEGNYENVWSRKVLMGQPFDLPTPDEVKELANWNDLKYIEGEGYTNTSELNDLTVVHDMVYYFDVDLREYTLDVGEIQSDDGSTYWKSFTTVYGKPFDFSKLKETGTNIRDPQQQESTFTRFTQVTTTMQTESAVKRDAYGNYVTTMENIDLTKPVTGKMAEALLYGGTATANYEDNSLTAVFSFVGEGNRLEERSMILRKGDDPSAYMDEIAADINSVSTELGVQKITPALGPITQSTTYMVYCAPLNGNRAIVTYDTDLHCGGCNLCDVDTPADMDKLVGSLLFNLPPIERRGYTFDGWFTAPKGTTDNNVRATTRTVPEDGITLYAHWTPITVDVTFDPDLGTVSDTELLNRTVVYDTIYGLIDGHAVDFPVPNDHPQYHFLGWYTKPDTNYRLDEPEDDAVRLTEDDIVDVIEDITLYAHWRELIVIPTNVVSWDRKITKTYSDDLTSADCRVSYSIDYDDLKSVSDAFGYAIDYSTFFKDNPFCSKYVVSGGSEYKSAPTRPGTYVHAVYRPKDEYFQAFDTRRGEMLQIHKGIRPGYHFAGEDYQLQVKIVKIEKGSNGDIKHSYTASIDSPTPYLTSGDVSFSATSIGVFDTPSSTPSGALPAPATFEIYATERILISLVANEDAYWEECSIPLYVGLSTIPGIYAVSEDKKATILTGSSTSQTVE